MEESIFNFLRDVLLLRSPQDLDAAGRAVNVRMANDREIEARSVVLATGYVMPDIVRSTMHAVSS